MSFQTSQFGRGSQRFTTPSYPAVKTSLPSGDIAIEDTPFRGWPGNCRIRVSLVKSHTSTSPVEWPRNSVFPFGPKVTDHKAVPSRAIRRCDCHVSVSRTTARPPSPTEASHLPSVENVRSRTTPSWPVRVATRVRVRTSQTTTLPSAQPQANHTPSGENANARTADSRPVSTPSEAPRSASQSRTVRSYPPVASSPPAGEYSAAYTQRL